MPAKKFVVANNEVPIKKQTCPNSIELILNFVLLKLADIFF